MQSRLLAAALITLPMCAQPNGAVLFEKNCKVCHQAGSAMRAPLMDALNGMTPEAIRTALESGSMKAQGATLSAVERQTLASFLGKGSKVEATDAACAVDQTRTAITIGWNGWGVDYDNSRMQPAAMAGLDAASVPRLKLKWAFGIPGANTVNSQPAIVGGRMYFGSQDGTVYALNARTGCTYWTFKAAASVRSAMTVSAEGTLYFGDLKANAYALNSQTGKQLWRVQLDDHPVARITAAPKLWNNKLYVPISSVEEVSGGNPKYECCTFRGSVAAVDAATGKLIWKSYTIPDPPQATTKSSVGVQLHGPSGAAVWLSPTIDVSRKVLYIGTGNGYSDPATKYTEAVIAYDLETGSMKWSQQLTPGDGWNFACSAQGGGPNCPKDRGPDVDIGASPILRKNIILVGQKSGVVYGLDAESQGKLLWQTRIGKGGSLGGIQWGMASDDKTVYIALSDRRLGRWQEEGGLFALDIATGAKRWNTPAPKPECLSHPNCSAAQMAPVTLIPGVVLNGSMDGHMRAYAAGDGKIIWDFDTLRDFETINGVKARGGSISGSGAVVVGGIMYINSGYGALSGIPGNVVLAFAAE